MLRGVFQNVVIFALRLVIMLCKFSMKLINLSIFYGINPLLGVNSSTIFSTDWIFNLYGKWKLSLISMWAIIYCLLFVSNLFFDGCGLIENCRLRIHIANWLSIQFYWDITNPKLTHHTTSEKCRTNWYSCPINCIFWLRFPLPISLNGQFQVHKPTRLRRTT